MKPYKITVKLLLKDEHKAHRKKSRQVGEKKVSEKRHNEKPFFR